MDNEEYTAKHITVLSGLEPVRKRPAMYIGGTGLEGLHHLVWEVMDNAIDEALAGFCNEINITLLPDNMVSVLDNGRGIPVDVHKQTGKSALETVLTTLHAGAKFGSSSYKVSGGLHGVGVSAVNALSSLLKAEVYRDGKIYYQEYSQGAAKGKIKQEGETKLKGTKITFQPDSEIFDNREFNLNTILDHVRQQAYLTKKTKITVVDQRKSDKPVSYTFYFEGGIASYVRHLTKNKQVINAVPIYVEKEIDNVLVEIAIIYTDEYNERLFSFANNIYTTEGGTHVTGFRAALTRAINNYIKNNNLLKNGQELLTGEDMREGLNAVISVKLHQPQFEGQTKTKLGNPEVRNIVEQATDQGLSIYLEEKPTEARKIMDKCLLSFQARQAAKAARETVIRKGALEGMTLPGKLADCTSKKPELSEIYIVEGDSAGGSAKQARDRKFQAILPLRGKILNVERARLDRMLASEEVKALIIALGCGIGEQFNVDKVRYHKIVIMTDADVDGSHIRTLLLTLFYRYFPQIIEKGYLYIAQPPLYAISFGKEKYYAYSEQNKEEIVKKLADKSYSIQRYKGLGEMNPEQLWQTTMDPEERILLKVNVTSADQADKIFSTLMGDEVLPRRKFIQTRARLVKNLDI